MEHLSRRNVVARVTGAVGLAGSFGLPSEASAAPRPTAMIPDAALINLYRSWQAAIEYEGAVQDCFDRAAAPAVGDAHGSRVDLAPLAADLKIASAREQVAFQRFADAPAETMTGVGLKLRVVRNVAEHSSGDRLEVLIAAALRDVTRLTPAPTFARLEHIVVPV